MATRAAWALRAAVVTAMVTGLLVVAQPAHAQPSVQLASIGNVELKVGGAAQTVQLRLRNTATGDPETDTATNIQFTMTLPLGNEGVGISSAGEGCSLSGNPPSRMDCTIPQLGPGEERAIVVQIAVSPDSPLPAGQDRNGTAQVTLGTGGTQTFNIRVRGPDQAPTITQIAGVVTDQATGEPIENATVLLIDGAGAEHTRGTDSQGRFDIRPEPNRPIAPGRIAMRPDKDGYQGEQYQHPVALAAGESATGIQLAMVNQQTPESPTPEPTESPTPEPTETPSPAAGAPPLEEDSGGLTFFTTVMIIVGLLLVLLGVGAIAFLIWRRRREEDEDDGGFDDADDPVSGPRGPTPTPGSRGVYRPTPTQVAGAGGATQVIPRAGAPGSGLPAVGPSPALAQTNLMPGGPAASDATTVLPRADDPTQVGGFGDERTRTIGADDSTRLISAPGASPVTGAPTVPGGPMSGGPRGSMPGQAPASGPAGSTPGSPPTQRRAAPQPPTFNGAPEQPYGYDQGAYSSRYDEPAHRRPHAGGGYDEPTGRFDHDAGPRAGGTYGRTAHDSGYGPDPYAQPSAGYGDYGTDSYSGGDYQSDQYRGGYGSDDRGYESGGYQGGSHDDYGGHAYQGSDYSGGYGQPSAGYGDPAAGEYGQPTAGRYGDAPRGGYGDPSASSYGDPSASSYGEPSAGGYGGRADGAGYGDPPAGGYGDAPGGGYGQPSAGRYPQSHGGYEQDDYYDETGRPRPRHSGPDRGWSDY